MSHYILYNLNKQKGLVKLQDVIFESATILVVVALCESSIYLYNCTSITGVSKDKTNAEKEESDMHAHSKPLYFYHVHMLVCTFYNKTYTLSFHLKHTGVIQVKCQVFPKAACRELNLRSAMSSRSSKLLQLR